MTRTRVPPVLVTGATGRIGRGVVEVLVDAGVPVRALTRRAEAEAGLPHQTPHPFFQQPNPMAVLHADIERLIAAAGLESTIIRPGMFSSNTLFWWAPTIRTGGAVRWPYGAAETAPVDDRDVAAVVARTLYQDGHAGRDYVLTGPQSLSQAEQVSIIGDVLGRRIEFEELSPEEFRSETAGSWPRPTDYSRRSLSGRLGTTKDASAAFSAGVHAGDRHAPYVRTRLRPKRCGGEARFVRLGNLR